MNYLVYVQDRNKDSGRFTLGNDEILSLKRGLALGQYSGVEVQVKKSKETVVILSAYACAKLDLRISNPASTWQTIDMRSAYQVMKEYL